MVNARKGERLTKAQMPREEPRKQLAIMPESLRNMSGTRMLPCSRGAGHPYGYGGVRFPTRSPRLYASVAFKILGLSQLGLAKLRCICPSMRRGVLVYQL